MRHRAAERAHKQDAAQADLRRQLEDGVAEGPPVQVRLLAEEEGEAGRLVTEELVFRHLQFDDPALHDLDPRTKQGVHLHRARELEEIEGLRINGGERPSTEQVHQALHGAGGDVAAVHPAGEGEQQSAAGQRGKIAEFQRVRIGVAHTGIVWGAAPSGREMTGLGGTPFQGVESLQGSGTPFAFAQGVPHDSGTFGVTR